MRMGTQLQKSIHHWTGARRPVPRLWIRSAEVRGANWEDFRAHMQFFCDDFMSQLEGKSVTQLWCDFKEALNGCINKFIPSRFVGRKRHLPWITQAIKREIRKRGHLFQKFKRSKDPKDRSAFLKSRQSIKQKIKAAHNKYFGRYSWLE